MNALRFTKDRKHYRRLSEDKGELVWALDEATEFNIRKSQVVTGTQFRSLTWARECA